MAFVENALLRSSGVKCLPPLPSEFSEKFYRQKTHGEKRECSAVGEKSNIHLVIGPVKRLAHHFQSRNG